MIAAIRRYVANYYLKQEMKRQVRYNQDTIWGELLAELDWSSHWSYDNDGWLKHRSGLTISRNTMRVNRRQAGAWEPIPRRWRPAFRSRMAGLVIRLQKQQPMESFIR